jgi:hypothetical protein
MNINTVPESNLLYIDMAYIAKRGIIMSVFVYSCTARRINCYAVYIYVH